MTAIATTSDEAVPPCIFCDRASGSVEHAWPDWLARHLLANGLITIDGAWSTSEQSTNKPGETIAPLLKKLEVTVDTVCDICNGGWMRKLEDAASPILKPIILGDRTPLTKAQQFTLTRWAVKTAIVLEGASEQPFQNRTSRSDCFALRLQRKIPPGTVIWMCPYEGAFPFSHSRFAPNVGQISGQEDAWHTVFTMGKVVIEVLRHPRQDAWDRIVSTKLLNYCGPLFPSVADQFIWPARAVVERDIRESLTAMTGALDIMLWNLFPG